MSILTGPEIVRIVSRTRGFREAGTTPPLPMIDIDPFDESRAGPNSYDVLLGNKLRVYTLYTPAQLSMFMGLADLSNCRTYLDVREANPTHEIEIPESGYLLQPGVLYLGHTVERTMTAGCVPWLDGRSSIGRLGIQIHATAGRGDDGFGCNDVGGCSWTMEISVVHPVLVYPNLRIGQLTFFTIEGERLPYSGRYTKQDGPTASKLHEEPNCAVK